MSTSHITLGVEKAILLIHARAHHNAKREHRRSTQLMRKVIHQRARVAALETRIAQEAAQ